VRCECWRIALLWIGLAPTALAICQEPPLAQNQKPQENSSTPASPAPAASPGTEGPSKALEPSPLDTFWLKDSKGALVPVLGMSFEEFEQLWRLRRGLGPPAPPPYVLERLSLTGSAAEQVAECRLSVTVSVQAEGWQRVPLRMASGVIRNLDASWAQGGRLLSFDPAAGGYVVWLKGTSGQPQTFELPVAFPVAVSGEQRRVSLALPRATEALLRLALDRPAAEASMLSGEGILTREALPDGRSELVVLGAAGDVQLAWRTMREAGLGRPPTLDVNGELVVRVESQRRVATDARLRVRSYTAPIEAFQVRLPPGMELIPTPSSPAYTLRPLPEARGPARGPAQGRQEAARDSGTRAGAPQGTSHQESKGLPSKPAAAGARPAGGVPPSPTEAAEQGQLVEVRFERPSLAPPDVQLSAELPGDRPLPAKLMPARFEVLSATRQRGTIDFAVDGQWQLEWSEDGSVHRLDLTPEAAASRLVARFEYFRQPCELALAVAPRPSRVSVEPTHLIYVDPQQVRVETTLKYRFRGARASGLNFELGDWELERLTPDASLDLPVRKEPIRGRLEVPFLPGAAPAGELELKLEAHRRLSEGTQRLVLTLPRPVADLVAPATVWVFAADNLELTPLGDELVGLTAEQPAPRPATAQGVPLVYRDLGGGEPALFVATLRRRQRVTTVSGQATVRVERQQLQIEQRLEYRVAHDPQRNFWLTVPQDVVASGTLQVWFDGEPLPVETQTAVADPADSTLVRLGFALPAAQLGMFQVLVRQNLPLAWDRQGAYPLSLPLPVPPDEPETRFLGQRVDFLLGEGLRVEPELETVDDLARPLPVPSAGAVAAFTWEKPVCLSHWTLRLVPGVEGTLVTVPQMWVQTWLAPGVRRDRVCLRLTTARESVRLRLPPGVQATSVQVAVDAREVRAELRQPRTLIVPLAPAAAQREYVVEVGYTLPPPEAVWGWQAAQLQAAVVEEAAPPRRMYWQLVLPEDQTLLLPPNDLVAEMAPASGLWPWLRQPVMDQPQLEAWVQATRQPPLPRASQRYLFGTLSRWPVLKAVVVPRRLLVVGASSVILVLGLLLIHVPALRRPGLLWTGAVAILAGSLVAPETALVVAQAGWLGMIVLLAAAAMAWLAAPPQPRVRPAPMPLAAAAFGEGGSARPSPSVKPDRSSQRTATLPAAAVEVPP
jgi:hypothetical protein